MYNENNSLNENSPTILQPKDINILLKNHQLASVYKALDIEKFHILPYGIMNDKPGSGKTYTILALI